MHIQVQNKLLIAEHFERIAASDRGFVSEAVYRQRLETAAKYRADASRLEAELNRKAAA